MKELLYWFAVDSLHVKTGNVVSVDYHWADYDVTRRVDANSVRETGRPHPHPLQHRHLHHQNKTLSAPLIVSIITTTPHTRSDKTLLVWILPNFHLNH